MRFKHSGKRYTAAWVCRLSKKLVGFGVFRRYWVISGLRSQSIVATMFVHSWLCHNFVLENEEISLRRGLLYVPVVEECENGSVFFSFLSCDNCLVRFYRGLALFSFRAIRTQSIKSNSF
jgi:hypothetical protein